ncbi:MAG: acetoacetate decarboxylase family protein [Actinomycetota bacterium]
MTDFFEGINQIEIKAEAGDIRFPIFYRDARMFTLILPANLMKLRKMLPDPRFSPAQLVPGVGALTLTAFEYYDTDIQAYNEFSMGIVLNSPYFAPVPGYNLLRQYFADMFDVFIYHLPVTTELALRGGIDYYNYPKFLAGIEFSDTPDRVTCDLSREGEHLMTVSGPKVPASARGEMKFICNLYQYRQPQQAEFKLNVVEGAVQWLPSEVAWSFNTASDVGAEMADCVLGNRAALYLYMPKIQCILYGPEHLSFQLLKFAMETGIGPPKPAAKKKKPTKPAKKKATKA